MRFVADLSAARVSASATARALEYASRMKVLTVMVHGEHGCCWETVETFLLIVV